MRKLFLSVVAASCLSANAHIACETIANPEKNLDVVIALVEQTSPLLSPQARMFLAVAALESGLEIQKYDRTMLVVPSALEEVPLDDEERAVIAVASVKYNTPVFEVMARVNRMSSARSMKERILFAVSTYASGRSIESMNAAAEIIHSNP